MKTCMCMLYIYIYIYIYKYIVIYLHVAKSFQYCTYKPDFPTVVETLPSLPSAPRTKGDLGAALRYAQQSSDVFAFHLLY